MVSAMQFFEGYSDGIFEMSEDWLVECILCGQQHRIDRRSLNISVMEQGDVFEHYFWKELTCKGCGERLFVRTKVYSNKNGDFIREDHECDDVDYIQPPAIRDARRHSYSLTNGSKRVNYGINRERFTGGRRMDNLCLLTEERPKPSVVNQIVDMYCKDFDDRITVHNEIKIKPIIVDGIFKFVYKVEGLAVAGAADIFIKTVSGSSSFLDFLLFNQEKAPTEGSNEDNLIMAIEETKTSDDESRNTGVYQRGSKFVYITPYYQNVKLYMLYNEELEAREEKKPSDTSVFGTNILLTLGVTIVGKDISRWFRPFRSLDELIRFKAGMRKPPAGNVPITITKYADRIEVSGRLAKPADAGNIGHDPNIGALSMISACIRKLGWDKDIVVTLHGVTQSYVDHTRGKNKFLYICSILGMRLDGIRMPNHVILPELYWHYEKKSEKMADILLHVQTMYHGMYCVYENHAGCERGYFKTKTGRLVTLPKKDRNGVNLYLPDVVLYDEDTNFILLVEGKMLSTLQLGIEEIENYDSIEQEYIYPEYGNVTIMRCVSIFGGNCASIPHEKVLFYLADNGRIIINKNAPQCIRRCFAETGVRI